MDKLEKSLKQYKILLTGWGIEQVITPGRKQFLLKCLKEAEEQVKLFSIPNVTTRNWFQRMPLHWRYTYYMIGGIIIGYLLHYVW